MVSYALSLIKEPIFWKHIQYEFSDCRCDIVCIWHQDNFLTGGAAKLNLSSFQSLAPGLQSQTTGNSQINENDQFGESENLCPKMIK